MKTTPPGGATMDGPLAGIRVLELGSTVAGPFCGRLLADFGAEVIKVEAAGGDTVRTMGKRFHGRSLYAASIFRNKALVSIDLHTEKGQELVRRLAARSDVVIENFKPGTLEKWHVGYDDLAAVNPGLVMVRISGFGQTGPYAARPGFGVIGEAVSGLRHLLGVMGRPELAADPRFGTAVERSRNEDALDALIADWTGGLDLPGIESRLEAAHVPASRLDVPAVAVYSDADAAAP